MSLSEPARDLPAPRPRPAQPSPSVKAFSVRRRWLAFAGVMLGFFTILAAATSVNTALTVIERDLHANLSQIEWMVDSYFLTLTVLMTTFGRFGDIFGRKRIFIGGGMLFIAGSLGSAFARDINVLITFRALTAVGPAMMMPQTLSLITDLFPPHERGFPLGIWGSMAGVAIGVGPVMGGVLVSYVSWQSVFWINVILGIITLVMAAILLPESSRRAGRPPLDFPGIFLLGAAMFCLSYALVEGNAHGWSSPLILGLFAGCGILFPVFGWREFTARGPMLDLNLFRRPAFTAGAFVALTVSFGLLGVFVLMPLFLQGPRGQSPVASGLTLLPV